MRTRRSRIIGGVVLAIAAVTWLLVNKPVEGRTLLVVTPSHGLTVADVPGVLLLLLAVVIIVRARR